jgi:hypothetical protein
MSLVLLAACAAPPDGRDRGVDQRPVTTAPPPVTTAPPACLRVEVETDWTQDGSPTTREVAVYDPDGRVVHDESDVDGSDDPSDHEASDWTYDGHGRPATRAVYLDGVLDRAERWDPVYDADGHELEEAYYWRGRRVEERRRWTWDDLGQRLEETVDQGDDGTIDETTTWVWIDGRVATEESVDAPPTRRLRSTYDADGHLVRSELDDLDDGDVDASTAYTYDDRGNLVLDQRDTDGDGQIDVEVRTTNTYDASERLIEQAVSDEDGVVAYRTTFTWDGDEVATESFFMGPALERAWTATTTRAEEECPGG